MPAVHLLDIEKAVTEWAWNEYVDTENRKQKKLRKKEEKNKGMYVGVTIDWSDVKFHDETKWPRIDQEMFDENENKESGGSGEASSQLTGLKKDLSQNPDQGATHASILFHTKFTNNTEDDQDYTMKTEKTTTSTCSTEIENSWSKSWELGVTLKTPGEIFEANAGYSREVSLTKTEGETFEESLTWGVESQIKVKSQNIAEAQLVVNEKKYSGDFVVMTTISGMVYVSFTEIRDNNSIIKATGNEFYDIIKWYIDRERRKARVYEYVNFKDTDEGQYIEVTTKGKCKFRFGIKQEVVVHQTPIG